jgi:hydrogenase maturation protease
MKDLHEKLLTRLKNHSRIVFMGIGEEKLSDDGVGPYIISELLTYSNDTFLFINGATDPMARMEEVIAFNPSHLVLIDTCSLNAEPGTVAIVERDGIKELVPISSHTIPIHIMIDLILEKLSNLDAFMIGIVPESLEGFIELRQYKQGELSLEELNENVDLPFFEINLTPKIEKVANEIIELIKSSILNL